MFWGRAGQSVLSDNSQEAVYEALLRSDSICFGDAASVETCASLLKDARTSRTTSYLLSLGGTCNDVAEKVANIRSASVLVVGCGGIGALLAMNLCGAGVGSLHLVDSDSVDRSNLNRQFFWSIGDVFRPDPRWTLDYWRDFFGSGGLTCFFEKVEQLESLPMQRLQKSIEQYVDRENPFTSRLSEAVREAFAARMVSIRSVLNRQRDFQGVAIQTWQKK